jgi:hypothetical protein
MGCCAVISFVFCIAILISQAADRLFIFLLRYEIFSFYPIFGLSDTEGFTWLITDNFTPCKSDPHYANA